MCHHFWISATANPPKSDDRYAELTRGAFMINDFLQNPHFRSCWSHWQMRFSFVVLIVTEECVSETTRSYYYYLVCIRQWPARLLLIETWYDSLPDLLTAVQLYLVRKHDQFLKTNSICCPWVWWLLTLTHDIFLKHYYICLIQV